MNQIICGDSIKEIKKIESESIHLILSDIPYGISVDKWDVIHNNTNSALLGASPAQQKSSLFKTRGKPLNGWSEADKKIPIEYYNWCHTWAADWLRVLKPGASCFIFAGRRFSHRCICALEDAGFIFKDMLSWQKDVAAYRAQNVKVVFSRRDDIINSEKWDGWKIGNLRPLFEPILWFMKPYPIGKTLTDNIAKYELGGFNETFVKNNLLNNRGMEICSNIIKCKMEPSDRGLHPTQKPVSLMEFLIGLTTIENQIVLDPFCGCGSTLLAAKNLNRHYVGIEIDENYCEIIKNRLNVKE
jgi:site-specific DNA-methyltransferase (adenine-specific)